MIRRHGPRSKVFGMRTGRRNTMPVELMSAIDEANATRSPANRLVAEEDASLVAAAKARDTRAFELLVERHERKIFLTAQRITRNREDAEDVCSRASKKRSFTRRSLRANLYFAPG